MGEGSGSLLFPQEITGVVAPCTVLFRSGILPQFVDLFGVFFMDSRAVEDVM